LNPHEVLGEFVYRALLKEKIPTDVSFRLRPSEPTMSIARTPEKAMGTLKCKAVAKMSTQEILAIPGLTIGVKTEGQENPEHPDQDLLEICGIPLYEDPEVSRTTGYAIALAATVKESIPIKR
jgi:hypothetical protein